MKNNRLVPALTSLAIAALLALLLPACSRASYKPEDLAACKDVAFRENLYTAPASITGLPAVAVGGVQLIGEAFSDNALLDLAALYGKED